MKYNTNIIVKGISEGFQYFLVSVVLFTHVLGLHVEHNATQIKVPRQSVAGEVIAIPHPNGELSFIIIIYSNKIY